MKSNIYGGHFAFVYRSAIFTFQHLIFRPYTKGRFGYMFSWQVFHLLTESIFDLRKYFVYGPNIRFAENRKRTTGKEMTNARPSLVHCTYSNV